MSLLNDSEGSTKPRYAKYLRFTESEYRQLEKDETRSGKTAQELLKAAYFQDGGLALLMSDEEKAELLKQIHRIGHNVNQIARKVNSGFAEGFHAEINEVRSYLFRLLTVLTCKYRKHELK